MGADPKSESGSLDGGKIGLSQIVLAEMHEVRARCDGFAPIVVDDELAVLRSTELHCFGDLHSDASSIGVLDAKLD